MNQKDCNIYNIDSSEKMRWVLLVLIVVILECEYVCN